MAGLRRNVRVLSAGGLGNQLFKWAAGWALATRLGAGLEAEIGTVAGDSKRENELDSFESGVTYVSVGGRWGRVLGPPRFAEQSFRFDPRFTDIERPVSLVGYFQSWRYFADHVGPVTDRISRIRQPSPWFLRQREEIARLPEPPVVVHVRAGDYLDPAIKRAHGFASGDYYREAMGAVRDAGVRGPVVVFSDDVAYARWLLDRVPVYKYISPPGTERPIESLILMGMGQAHVLANSSFSWWGATLARQGPGLLTFAPKPWFGDLAHDTEDLLWPGWHEISRE